MNDDPSFNDPIRGLLFAVPISIVLWIGLVSLVWWFFTAL